MEKGVTEMISKEALEEYKKIYKEHYGKDISDKEALEQATSLLTMMKAIYKPIKKEEYKKAQQRRDEIMKNKKSHIFTESWVVFDVLKQIGRDEATKTKFYELMVAYMLSLFCERQWGVKPIIGLELKEKCIKDIPTDGMMVSTEQFLKIVNVMTEENTPTDIVIGRKIIRDGKEVHQGMPFQLKRFGKGKNQNNTDDLIRYLNEDIKKSYGKSDVSLVVILEPPDDTTNKEDINLKKVSDSLESDGYPFNKVMLVSASQGKLNFVGIYPEKGSSQFNTNTLQFDY